MSNVPLPPVVNLGEFTSEEVSAMLTLLMKFPAEQVYGLLKKIEQRCVDAAKAAAAPEG